MSVNSLVPMVIENDGRSERSFDLYSALMKERTIFLNGNVTPESTSILVAQLFYLNYQSEDKPINLYINSNGGSVYHGLSVLSAMKSGIRAKVHVYAMGICASMGSFLVAAGERGHRYAAPETTFMLHQVSSGSQGKLGDMEIDLAETQRLNEFLTKKYVEFCGFKGKDYNFFKEKMRHDYFLTAEEALEIGLIDHIISEKT
jgi:ATP-dependent Clp protease protease subunit